MYDYDAVAAPSIRDYLHALTANAGMAIVPEEMQWAIANDTDVLRSWIDPAAGYAAADYHRRLLAGVICYLRDEISHSMAAIEDIASFTGGLADAVRKYCERDRDRDTHRAQFAAASRGLVALSALRADAVNWQPRNLTPAGEHRSYEVQVPADGPAGWPLVRANILTMSKLAADARGTKPISGRPVVGIVDGEVYVKVSTDHRGRTSHEAIIDVDGNWLLHGFAWQNTSASGPASAPECWAPPANCPAPPTALDVKRATEPSPRTSGAGGSPAGPSSDLEA
ncbi:hypothetical protein [Pilimelia anulata]|uniref:hypothetical protein n=1 Tax=Pilimelia anulata TaxID=53371 RepID=UPI001669FED7|nr:hypothetical protein [Pilimelia anulata]